MEVRERLRSDANVRISVLGTIVAKDLIASYSDPPDPCQAQFNWKCMKTILVTSFVILALFSGVVIAQDNVEKKKIDFLISSVDNLNEAKFIRNGTEHDGTEAAEHLRMKLQKAGGKVQTADDFIRLCGSHSYISGKPYLIRFSIGNTIKAEQYFRKRLHEYSSNAK
jgi:hypothetical protein